MCAWTWAWSDIPSRGSNWVCGAKIFCRTATRNSRAKPRPSAPKFPGRSWQKLPAHFESESRNDFSMKPDRSTMPLVLTAKYFLGWLLLAGVLFNPSEARSGEPALTEYQVKALCVVNFARYTEWPATAFADTNAPLVIGIIGEPNLQNSLQSATSNK